MYSHSVDYDSDLNSEEELFCEIDEYIIEDDIAYDTLTFGICYKSKNCNTNITSIGTFSRYLPSVLYDYDQTELTNYSRNVEDMLRHSISESTLTTSYEIFSIVFIDYEYVPVIKTRYLIIIQKAWKKLYKERNEQISKNISVKSILNREIKGRFLYPIPNLTIKGLLLR